MNQGQDRSIHSGHRHGNPHGIGRFYFLINVRICKGQIHRPDLSGFINDGFNLGCHVFSWYQRNGKLRVLRHGIFRHHNGYPAVGKGQGFLIRTDRIQRDVAGDERVLRHVSLVLFVCPAIQMLLFRCIRQLAHLLTVTAHALFGTAVLLRLLLALFVGLSGEMLLLTRFLHLFFGIISYEVDFKYFVNLFAFDIVRFRGLKFALGFQHFCQGRCGQHLEDHQESNQNSC